MELKRKSHHREYLNILKLNGFGFISSNPHFFFSWYGAVLFFSRVNESLGPNSSPYFVFFFPPSFSSVVFVTKTVFLFYFFKKRGKIFLAIVYKYTHESRSLQ